MTGRKPRGLMAFLTAAVAIGLVALVLSIQNALNLDRQADQRERDRVASDLRACERGNDLRRQIIGIGDANEALVDGILDTIFAESRNQEAVELLRGQLAPLFDAHASAVDEIEITDCAEAVRGA